MLFFPISWTNYQLVICQKFSRFSELLSLVLYILNMWATWFPTSQVIYIHDPSQFLKAEKGRSSLKDRTARHSPHNLNIYLTEQSQFCFNFVNVLSCSFFLFSGTKNSFFHFNVIKNCISIYDQENMQSSKNYSFNYYINETKELKNKKKKNCRMTKQYIAIACTN